MPRTPLAACCSRPPLAASRQLQWKDGARNTAGGKDGGRDQRGENKALSAASRRYQPYSSKCTVCKQSLHQQGIYCQTCAYSKGARCGDRSAARIILAREGLRCLRRRCAHAAPASRAGVCAMCGIQILDVTYYRQSGAGGDVEAAAKKREEAAVAFQAECAEEAAKRAYVPC
jgi:hypothetical protein